MGFVAFVQFWFGVWVPLHPSQLLAALGNSRLEVQGCPRIVSQTAVSAHVGWAEVFRWCGPSENEPIQSIQHFGQATGAEASKYQKSLIRTCRATWRGRVQTGRLSDTGEGPCPSPGGSGKSIKSAGVVCI